MKLTRSRSGSAMVEFTLVGLPLIFILISIVEVARGMWIYQTLAHAVKEGTRFAAVKGADYKFNTKDCATCSVTVGHVVGRVTYSGVGLDPNEMVIDLYSQAGNFPDTGTRIHCPTANSCPGAASVWPPEGEDTVNSRVRITARIPFDSALSFFWIGAGPGQVFGRKWFSATSQDVIQF